jgi:hypothetical protein
MEQGWHQQQLHESGTGFLYIRESYKKLTGYGLGARIAQSV